MPSSTPFTNRTASSVLNVRASSSASFEHHGRRRVAGVLQFPGRQPQDQPVDDGQPLEPPVLRVLLDQRVELGDIRGRAEHERSRELAHGFGRVGLMLGEERLKRLRRARSGRLPRNTATCSAASRA